MRMGLFIGGIILGVVGTLTTQLWMVSRVLKQLELDGVEEW